MRLEARKYLYDMRRAAEALTTFTTEKTFDDYQADAMLRSAAERQFETIGEALNLLAKVDAEIAERISDHRRIVAFRNVLIHGYAEIDDRLVSGVIERNLSTLRAEVDALLTEDDNAT